MKDYISATTHYGDAMSTATILFTKHDRYAVIQINRPQQLNALNSAVLQEVYAALFDVDHDDAMSCTILTGNEKAFAAGADIKEMRDKDQQQMIMDNQFAPFDHMRRLKKPVIAAVNGFALGGGCELVMACDIIIAGETAKFGQPEINLGVIPGMGGTQRLTRAVGKYRAMELMLTGDLFTAPEALAWGLVNKVVPPDRLMDEATALAQKLAAKPLLAVKAIKELVLRSYNEHLDAALESERHRFNALFDTEDQKEGMTAFIEKRKPSWKGR